MTDSIMNKVVTLKNLESLVLANCPKITNEGFKRIGEMKHLESLNLIGNIQLDDSGKFF